MITKLLLTGLLVLCIATVSGQGYHVKTIQNDTKSVQELQSPGFMKVNTDKIPQGADKELFQEAVLKSATVKQRLDSVIYTKSNGYTKYEYTYGDNKLQNECNFYIQQNNLWKPNMNWKYFYNESGKIFKTINSWYGASPGWVHEFLYFYNADGRVKELTIDAGAKLEFTWDAKGNLTKLNWINNPGADYDYEIYVYDAKGNLTEVTAYINSVTIVWHNEFIYDSNNRIKQANNYDSLAGRDTVYYSYDLDDNLISETNYWWRNNVREVYGKTEYTYDNLYSFSDLILPVSVYGSFLYPGDTRGNIYFNHKLLSYKNNEAGGWQNSVKYYYSDFSSQKGITSSDEINTEVVSLYPNPVSDKLHFNFRDNYCGVIFQLFDVRGTKVMEREIFDNQCLNMDDLATGMYLYNVVAEKSRQSGRLVKY